jgi:hypothetical protein
LDRTAAFGLKTCSRIDVASLPSTAWLLSFKSTHMSQASLLEPLVTMPSKLAVPSELITQVAL